MNKLISVLTFLFFVNVCDAQQAIKEYVQSNTKPVRSIKISDTDFSDLEAIGNSIGNSRIVMLGEQDHGDAPAFEAKARLIKYLHQNKGFEVIAFESDFYGLVQGWEEVQKGEMTLKTL